MCVSKTAKGRAHVSYEISTTAAVADKNNEIPIN